MDAVVPAAATMAERRSAPWLQPIDTPAERRRAADRWRRWMNQAAHGDGDAFDAMLAERGLSAEHARAGVATVELVPGAPLPRWAQALPELLTAVDVEPSSDDLALAASLTEGGRFWLGDEAAIPLPEGFAAAMLAALAPAVRAWLPPDDHWRTDGLEAAIVSCVLHEVLLASLGSLRSAPATQSWVTLLRRHPALARVLGFVALGGRCLAREVTGHLVADGELVDTWLDSSPAGPHPPTQQRLGPLSDRHAGGRFVVALGGPGQRLLYKPKDLRLGDALADLVRALDLGLQMPDRLTRDGHAWELFVERRLPSEASEWRLLAREVGMWVRLFDVLGATDLVTSNLVVSGSHVVPVDTETALSFTFRAAGNVAWTPPGVRSGLITAPLVGRTHRHGDDMGLFARPEHAPLLEHVDELVAGFSLMHARLVTERTRWLARFNDWVQLPGRALVRSTWVYLRLLLDSLQPAALSDGVDRDLVMERLWRARPAWLPPAVIESETAALRDVDIPLFSFLPGGRDLYGNDGVSCGAVLTEAPIEGVRARLLALRPEPEAAELDALRSLVFCAAATAPRQHATTAPARGMRAPTAPAPNWAEHAHAAGRQLVELLRHGGPERTRLRAGLVYVPHNDVFVVAPSRGTDLLSGSAGIALVLDALARLTGDHCFAEEAVEQAAATAAGAGALVADLARWQQTGTHPPLDGLFWGLPSMVHTLAALHRDDATELRPIEDVLVDLEPAACWSGSPPRLLPPAALLVALLGWECDRLDALRGRLAAQVADDWREVWPAPPRRSAIDELIPSDGATAALALARWATACGQPLATAVTSWRDAPDEGRPADRLVRAALGRRVAPPVPSTSHAAVMAIDELLTTYRLHGNAASADAASTIGHELRERHRQAGRWFPEDVAPDRFRLGALWGLAAVAHAFVGLAAPARWRSLRLLETVPSGR